MEDCDQKPGSRLSHFRYKFGIQTSKSLHYCSICATNKDSYCFEYQQYGNQPIQYSINKKSRFQIVRSLCAEMQRQRKKRKQELKQKNRKDVSFKGNCASFAAAKYCKRPKLPKMYSANRPKIVTRPTLFPIRISKTSLDKVIEGTFEDLQPIYSKDKYQDDDVLCYLLANQHACSHQVKQTCQDCNGWYIAYTQLGGGEVSYRGTSVDNKNRGRYATTLWFVEGKRGPQWCMCSISNGKGKMYNRQKEKDHIRKKKQNRKLLKWNKLLDWNSL